MQYSCIPPFFSYIWFVIHRDYHICWTKVPFQWLCLVIKHLHCSLKKVGWLLLVSEECFIADLSWYDICIYTWTYLCHSSSACHAYIMWVELGHSYWRVSKTSNTLSRVYKFELLQYMHIYVYICTCATIVVHATYT